MFLVTLMFGFAACSSSTEKRPQCVNDAQCELNEQCVDDTCIAVGCIESADCAWGYHCNTQQSCALGCMEATDCMNGEACLEGVCVANTCEDTQIDCQLGEICLSGTCQASEPSACALCDYQDWSVGMAAPQECVLYEFDTSLACDWQTDTGCPVGMHCYPDDGQGLSDTGFCVYSYAFLLCESSTDCPRGFYCREDIYRDDSQVNVCWGDCPFYRQQGLID